MNERDPWELSIESVSAVCDAWAIDHSLNNRNAPRLVFMSIAAPASTIMGFRGLIHGSASNKANASLSPLFTPDDEITPERITNIHTAPLRRGRQFQRPLSGLQRQHHYLCLPAEVSKASAGQNITPDEETDEDEPATHADAFYIFAPNEDDGPNAFYRQFIRRSPTPTLPQWADRIWDAAESRQYVVALKSSGICAWRCEVNYDEIEAYIVNNLKHGRLPTG